MNIRFLSFAWLLTVGCVARAAAPAADQTMHPAVVRITAPGDRTTSYGSGTLVAVGAKHGLVITNWHVINEATGTITVDFPGGFRSAATVQKADKDWDLAALAIWRPPVEPVRMATTAPQQGESLTIAGYGSGKYRAVSGPCTQYVAPGTKFPYEMVELAASARQGDSGGPILNSRGELAGVLFGEGHGRTSGSYCGRVQWFMSSITGSALPTQDAPNLASLSTATPAAQSLAALPFAAGASAQTQPTGALVNEVAGSDTLSIAPITVRTGDAPTPPVRMSQGRPGQVLGSLASLRHDPPSAASSTAASAPEVGQWGNAISPPVIDSSERWTSNPGPVPAPAIAAVGSAPSPAAAPRNRMTQVVSAPALGSEPSDPPLAALPRAAAQQPPSVGTRVADARRNFGDGDASAWPSGPVPEFARNEAADRASAGRERASSASFAKTPVAVAPRPVAASGNLLGNTRAEEIQTFLMIAGGLALTLHLIRWMTTPALQVAGPPPPPKKK